MPRRSRRSGGCSPRTGDPGVKGPLGRPGPLVLVAVLAPAAIVAVLGYVSLRQWARSSELLFREQARDMASMTADKIGMMLRVTDDDLVARLQATLLHGEALEAFLASAPLVDRLYLLDRHETVRYPTTPREGDAVIVASLTAGRARDLWERGGRRDFVVGDHLVLATVVKSAGGEPLLAALSRSREGLRREVFDRTFASLDVATLWEVLDGAGRPVYERSPLADADLVASVPFRERPPGWRLALSRSRSASPGTAVRRKVALLTAALAVLLVVIAAGIVATYRLVRREMEMARLKSDFVANVSHDLKTPLSVVRMYSETLDMGRVTDEAKRREYYRVITRESERLSRLIDNVLDFSRIDSGRRRYEMTPTAVEPLVREAVEAFAYPLTQEGFKVEVEIAPDLPLVPLDAEAVGQALSNLVDNALKYSADRRVLGVAARVVGDELALEVTDLGIGIPANEHERIFDKFYRVGRSDTQGRRGSGVGLALVRHVAEAHGGRVTVDSRLGEGSRFTVWLPVTPGGGRSCHAS